MFGEFIILGRMKFLEFTAAIARQLLGEFVKCGSSISSIISKYNKILSVAKENIK